MPTGYTADVQSGKVTKFSDFALQCARAFGALITMRDDPTDAPIPDKFNPSTHNKDALATALQRLSELQNMTAKDADAGAQQAFKEAISAKRKYDADKATERARYEAMIDQVRAWVPPTPDHEGMKDFMLEQLQESLRVDCYGEYWQKIEHQTGEKWLAAQIAEAERNVAFHTEEDRKERERAAMRTAWIRALKASL